MSPWQERKIRPTKQNTKLEKIQFYFFPVYGGDSRKMCKCWGNLDDNYIEGGERTPSQTYVYPVVLDFHQRLLSRTTANT